jgi:hypothetical protein
MKLLDRLIWHGKQRLGLAVMALSSNWWLTVRAFHGGSPVVLRVEMGSRHLGEASWAGVQAREAMVQRGGGGSSALTLWWGKVAKEVTCGAIYKGKSLGTRGAMTRCWSPTELRIHADSIENQIAFRLPIDRLEPSPSNSGLDDSMQKSHRSSGHAWEWSQLGLAGQAWTTEMSHPVLRSKSNAHRMYAQDQDVIHTARMWTQKINAFII